MSLLVHVFTRTADGDFELEDPTDDPTLKSDPTLGGFESWRRNVWGSKFIIGLGAKFLPELGRSDLYVENEDLDQFEAECTMLLEYCGQIANDTSILQECIHQQLRIYLNAARTARAKAGGVVIW